MAMVETTSVHRALADERRAALVAALRAGPLDAAELARRVGLHPNTVRFHLALLRDAGLVTSRPAARRTPGRPRILYALDRSAAHAADHEHRLLATILTGALGSSDDGADRAEDAGRAWGRYLVERLSPLAAPTTARIESELTTLLERHGFEPEVVGSEIRMRRCPFHELAESHPNVVCAVHRGLVSGALEELGADLEVDELQVFPQPGACVLRLRRAR